MYIYIIVPFTTLLVCQVIKFVSESIISKKIKWDRFFNGTGGMPSSHTALCASLTMTLGYRIGFDSSFFAIALVFSIITIYDAMGLRYESGKHARLLNKMNDGKLNEQLGHKPSEVICGILLAIIMSYIFCYIIF